MLTVSRLKELLHYAPDSGVFTWKISRSRTAKAGQVAGCLSSTGYRMIAIDRRSYKESRLAWFYTHEKWPPHFLDHRNGNPADNRIANLREATNGQNKACAGPQRNNALGIKGVSRDHRGYRAQIRKNGKKIYLGYFATPAEASAAYQRAAAAMHGEFAYTSPRER